MEKIHHPWLRHYRKFIWVVTFLTVGMSLIYDLSMRRYRYAEIPVSMLELQGAIFMAVIHWLAGLLLSGMVGYIQNSPARSSRILWAFLVAFYPCLMLSIPLNLIVGLVVVSIEVRQGLSRASTP